MLGDMKRDMQQERPYMLNATSTSRAEPGSESARATGLMESVAPTPGAPGAAPTAPTTPSTPDQAMAAPSPPPTGMAPSAGLSPALAGGESAGEGEPNVTPEEQEQYDKLMTLVTRFLHGAGAESVVERLQSQSQDLPGAMGAIVSELGHAFTASAREGGEELDDGVLFHAANETIGQLAEIAEASGVVDEVTPEMMEQALHSALSSYGNSLIQSGQQPEGDTAAIAQGLDYMKAQGAI